MGVDDAADDEEPEPEAAVRARRHRPLETLEDAAQVIGRDPDAFVAHLQDRARTVTLDRNPNWIAAPELRRIGDEVGDRLVDTAPIPGSDDRLRGVHEDRPDRRESL